MLVSQFKDSEYSAFFNCNETEKFVQNFFANQQIDDTAQVDIKQIYEEINGVQKIT